MRLLAGNRPILENIATLYGIHFWNCLLPLLTIPYLARVLGPAGLGQVALGQVIGAYLCQWIEFGFDLSATRQVARCADNPAERGHIAGRVFAAKAVLAVVGIVLVVTAQLFLKLEAKLFWSSILWGVSGGFSVLWYFQGTQNLRFAGAIDMLSKSLAGVSLLVFVRGDQDAWKVVALQGIASTGAVAAGAWALLRDSPVRAWEISSVKRTVAESWPIFVTKASSQMSQAGSVLLLSFYQPVAVIGLFSAAEKISRSAASSLQPIAIGMYPWISHLVRSTPLLASKLSAAATVFMAGSGIVFGVAVSLTAPVIVDVVLGSQFQRSVAVVRILGAWIAVSTFNTSLTLNWLLPRGLEGPLSRTCVAVAALNLGLTAMLARSFQESAAAWAMLLTQIAATVALTYVLRRMRKGSEMSEQVAAPASA